MRLFTRSLGLLVITAALIFGTVGIASAATAVVTPNGSVGGIGQTGWELTIESSTTPAATFNCANAGFTATVTNATGALPLPISSNYQQSFSNCRTGTLSYNFSCTPTATLRAAGLTTPSSGGGITPLTLTALNCTAAIGGCGAASITGTLPASFSNLAHTFTVPVAGQSLSVSGSTCSAIPNGRATFAATGGGAFTYTATPSATTINVF